MNPMDTHSWGNNLAPLVGQWYRPLRKGQHFCVTKVDREDNGIEVQHFDGDLEDYTFGEWRALEIEECEQPEDWSGPMDLGDPDDSGTDAGDAEARDWREGEASPRSSREDEEDAGAEQDDFGEGHMEEDSMTEEMETEGPGPGLPDGLTQRLDGVFQESFDDAWYAEYREEPNDGLWRVDMFKHDVPEWRVQEFDSLETAREAARNFYDQI